MSHYTIQSGQRQTVVSYVCPTCRRRYEVSPEHRTALQTRGFVPGLALYCDDQCEETHTTQLVWSAAQVYPIFTEDAYYKLQSLLQGYIPRSIAAKLQGVTL